MLNYANEFEVPFIDIFWHKTLWCCMTLNGFLCTYACSFNVGPVHFIYFNLEFYYFINYGWKQIVNQYSWLEKDLKVSSTFFIDLNDIVLNEYSRFCTLVNPCTRHLSIFPFPSIISRKPTNPKIVLYDHGSLQWHTDPCIAATATIQNTAQSSTIGHELVSQLRTAMASNTCLDWKNYSTNKALTWLLRHMSIRTNECGPFTTGR